MLRSGGLKASKSQMAAEQAKKVPGFMKTTASQIERGTMMKERYSKIIAKTKKEEKERRMRNTHSTWGDSDSDPLSAEQERIMQEKLRKESEARYVPAPNFEDLS